MCENKPALTVKLSVDGCVLSAQTTRIDDSLRGKGTLEMIGNYVICSHACGQLFQNRLCLSGDYPEYDGSVGTNRYNTPEDAKLARKAFQILIRRVNKKFHRGLDTTDEAWYVSGVGETPY